MLNKYKKAFKVLQRNFSLYKDYPLPSELTVTVSEDDSDFMLIYNLLTNNKETNMTDKEKKKSHKKTIKTHRKYVRQMCFKMGIPLQGLLHDLSKYSKEEFEIYKYYTGTCSPHQEMRTKFGYSDRWMYHYHKNKHHWQYWLDIEDYPDKVYPIKMPYKYVIESICDFVGAGRAYSREKWTQDSPWNYWQTKCKGKRLMHPDSEYLTEKLLWNIKELGLEGFIRMYNNSKDYLKENYEKGTLQSQDLTISNSMRC